MLVFVRRDGGRHAPGLSITHQASSTRCRPPAWRCLVPAPGSACDAACDTKAAPPPEPQPVNADQAEPADDRPPCAAVTHRPSRANTNRSAAASAAATAAAAAAAAAAVGPAAQRLARLDQQLAYVPQPGRDRRSPWCAGNTLLLHAHDQGLRLSPRLSPPLTPSLHLMLRFCSLLRSSSPSCCATPARSCKVDPDPSPLYTRAAVAGWRDYLHAVYGADTTFTFPASPSTTALHEPPGWRTCF